MSVPVSTPIVVNIASQLALAENSARTLLEVQNKSNNLMTIKFDADFLAAQSGVQKISFNRVPTGGNWTIVYGGQETTELAYNANAAAVQAALVALSTIGSGNMTVAGDYTAGFTCTFAGTLVLQAVTALTINENTLTDNTVQKSAQQLIHFSALPETGVFRCTFNGIETPDLAYNITAANLKLALNALASINGGVDDVTQDPISKDFIVSMDSSPLKNLPQNLIVITKDTITNTDGLTSEIQKLFAAPKPYAGTYKLMTPAGDTSAAIAFDALAATIQAALVALPSIGAGNVTVAALGADGNLQAGYSITFGSALANMPIGALLIENSLLVPDTLDGTDDDDDVMPDDVALRVKVTTPGVGAGPVGIVVSYIQNGVAPAACVSTVTVTTAGRGPDLSGTDIAANTSKLYDSDNTPISAMWIKAAVDGSNAVVVEG